MLRMSTKSARFLPVLVLVLSAPLAASEAVLELHWSDQKGYLRDKLVSRGYDTMAKEVSAILHDVGVEATWSSLTAEPTDGVVVILTSADATRWGLPEGTLGAVMGRGGPVTCVYVFYPAVARLLGVGRSRSTRDFHELGKAIGRVAAHELVHAITPQVPHTPGGLMMPHLTRDALRRSQLRMSTSAAAALNGALRDRRR